MSKNDFVIQWENTVKIFECDYDGPIQMLNMVTWKGGAEAISASQKYSVKVLSLLESIGAKLVYKAESLATVVGSEDWDVVMIVEYPTITVFHDYVNSAEFCSSEMAELRKSFMGDSYRMYCMKAPKK